MPEMGCIARQEQGAQHGEDRAHTWMGCMAHWGWGAQHAVEGMHSMPWMHCPAHQGWGAQHTGDGVLSQTSNQQHPTSPEHHLQLLSWEWPTDTGRGAVPPTLPAASPQHSAGPGSVQARPYEILGKAA